MAASVLFYVSGFGPFQGVPENPSRTLVEALERGGLESAAADAAGGAPAAARGAATLCRLDIFETSAAAVDAAFVRLRAELAPHLSARRPVVLLHFGVAAGSPSFCLEEAAYNEASFRVPDERGVQLRHARIDAGEELGARFCSTLPVAALAEALAAAGAGAGTPVAVSDDPGRFLCNYAFCRSLALTAELNAAAAEADAAAAASAGAAAPLWRCAPSPLMHSLFVHVPSATTASAAAQLSFARCLIAEVARAVRAGTPAYLHEHAAAAAAAAAAAPTRPPRMRALLRRSSARGDGGGGGSSEDAEAGAGAEAETEAEDDETLYEPLSAAALADIKSGGSGHAPPLALPAAAADEAVAVAAAGGGAAAVAAAADTNDDLASLLAFGFDAALCQQALDATREEAPSAAGPSGGAASGESSSHVERAAQWIVAALEAPAPAPPRAPTPRAAAASSSSSSSTSSSPAKLVIVVRGDLGMGAGKVAAQCCHAALRAAAVAPAALVRRWQAQGEPIVVLRCADLPALQALREAARARGLPTAPIRDAGRTQVEPGTTTVMAVGPAPADDIDAVTGALKLL